ncbi:DUF2293 domain-containing protein [Mycobacterium sp. ACS1612]|uniref:DUF2293 domain-containing protein n=1 Tax=Mycobacterium sp. ACS1612 TaxID=1834117 RepID=UPI001E58640E|nr:DUF2293 domain-containing protein [Mycobacterium sp. ACS1612]
MLIGLGWLAEPSVDRWMKGRAPALDCCLGVDTTKVPTALAALQHWGQGRGLAACEGDYQALHFMSDGDPDVERAYRTHWVLADAPEPVAEVPPRRPHKITVMLADTAATCTSCGGIGDLLRAGEAGALCLDCAGLGHLEFLPSGDAALTRRANKASGMSAVVMRWNGRRHRFERQGILVEPAAIERAAQQCLNDADARARRRAAQDVLFQEKFAAAIREQFPGCPAERAEAIALHTAARGSGRVGRSAAGRALDSEAVRLAVVASVRHVDTDYDELLMSGVDRESARAQVHARVEDIVSAWHDGVAMLDD